MRVGWRAGAREGRVSVGGGALDDSKVLEHRWRQECLNTFWIVGYNRSRGTGGNPLWRILAPWGESGGVAGGWGVGTGLKGI